MKQPTPTNRTLAVALGAALLLTPFAHADDPSSWPELVPPQAGFSIRMPGTPSHQFDAQAGTDSYQFEQGDLVYVASVAYLPRQLREMGPEKLLEQTKAAFVGGLPNSRLLRSSSSKIQGFPAVTFLIDAQPPGRPLFRTKNSAVMANGRLFSFGVSARSDLFVESEVDKYLATFRVR